MAAKAYEIQRRLGFLERAEETGHVGQTGRCFGIDRASVRRWVAAFGKLGEAGLVPEKPDPKNPKCRTPREMFEKVPHLRKTIHWYMANGDWWQPLRTRRCAGERLGTAAM